jgi:hypothetical protein
VPLRFDFLIAKLKRSSTKTPSKVALATSRPSGGGTNRSSFAEPALSLVSGETTTFKRRKAG